MGRLGGRTLILVLAVVILLAVSFILVQRPAITGHVTYGTQATASNCGSYTTNSNCAAYSNCVWKNDSWGGWCQELNCWSLYTQGECTGTPIEGKNCTWKPSGTTWSCDMAGCWAFDGTNQSWCESNTKNLNCIWYGVCYSEGVGSSYKAECWNILSENLCKNTTGCRWGSCSSRNCGYYNTAETCNATRDPQGRNCTWVNESGGSWCSENGCWRYGTNMSKTEAQRQTECESATGLNCSWRNSYCSDIDCWTWDNTNQTACESNNRGLSCQWSSWEAGQGSCMKKGCWNYNTNECLSQPKCTLRAYTTSGWCEEIQCWRWDGMNNGNQTACEQNPYNLRCSWENTPWNTSTGWCFPTITKTCTNFTTERECMDTFYCWWQYTNPSNPSAGGVCREPGNFSLSTNTSIFTEWNPGCYIFDTNATVCNKTIGCNYTNSSAGCLAVRGHAYEGIINRSGVNCTMINDSALCNTLGVFSSCCTWRNGSCQIDRMTTACWDQMQKKSEKACEDASNKARCDAIANFPWFMPCSWLGDNTTGKCSFKASNIFGNKTQTLMAIDNKKGCEAAGGKWITENYCEGSVSVPAGRCEYKFDEEDNCNKACFACELRDSNGAVVNASNAESACKGSALGFCEFVANTNAPNGVGFCKAKEQFKKGFASNCEANCGDCTFMGDRLSNDTTKRPDYICNNRKADASGNRCKWDNTTQTCVKGTDKICEDACDRCTTRWSCQNTGRTSVANTSGSCKWSGDDNTGTCTSNTGQVMEVCWDGVDNNNNTLTDCMDTACYSDPFCGASTSCPASSLGEAKCTAAGCEWVTDNWGSWCDMKGSQCWKYNQNVTVCNAQSSCQWNNGTGGFWCEQDWSRQEACMSKNMTQCTSPCNWTVDTWCQGQGNSTPWCQTNGGWCDHPDFKPKNCWMYSSTGSTECNSHSGCLWRTDQYAVPHCEVNNSVNCWNYSSSSSCSNAGCWWRTDEWGSWCTNKMDKCWSSWNETACAAQTDGGASICYWETWGGSGGSCQPLCQNSTKNTNSACSAVSGCIWKEQNGWCEESVMAGCGNYNNNENTCKSTAGCKWKSPGWCEPRGGGFSVAAAAGGGGTGGAMGAVECFRYDGNRTACTNKSVRIDNLNISCGWTPEPSPRCDVNWSTNCPNYPNQSACTGAGCWWKSDNYGSWCTNVMDQCWNNQSLQTQVACNQNTLCNWTGWSCQPMCMSKVTSTTCTTGALSGKCRWVTGWCNPSGMTEMFDGMQAGAPVPIGMDICPEPGKQASVDICGFGMKDMGDSYGFGMGVQDFSNASVCNKEKLSSFVMGGGGKMECPSGPSGGGGFGTTFGQERIGSGNETVIFIVYLDTDGMTTGGCTLSHNSSAPGYEFMLKYSSVWNINTSRADETFNAYKCEGNSWKAADIKLSAWKKMMCSEIGGAMIAVNKADLSKFTTLYNTSKDIRVSVATIGNTGNVTNPTDTAGPGWTTPGSIDFAISDVFSYGANTAMFEDILKKGFLSGEDCFNSVDDDNDGLTDCNDWDCQFAPRCASSGVNLQEDTRAPQVMGVKIEEYPDAAFITYDTNKPTNGTLELYGADSRCTNRTDVIYDIGILKSSTVRQYKLWHEAMIYDDGNLADNVSINYPLASGVTYYYKIKVCDTRGKCAVSRCSNFTTPCTNTTQCSTLTSCPYCNFVTRIKTASDWDVYYDLGQDGNYEHWQGHVCGPQAGLKTNYTDGRYANIKLMKSDNSTYFEFLNVSLTKTGLNDKVRTISGSGAIIHNTATGLVGLPSETRDKIINNLHPEVCKVKIQVPSGGVCDTLYQCDDIGTSTTCIDRTLAAGGAPLDAAACVWLVPYCEFSAYKVRVAGGDGGDGGGGGGGGGGGTTASTITVTAEQLAAGYTSELAARDRFRFTIDADTHYVTVHSLTATTATINVSSTTVQATLSIGETRNFEVTGDTYYDISVTLNSINTTASKVKLTLKSVHELIPSGAEAPTGPTGETGEAETGTGTGGAPTAGQPGELPQLDMGVVLPAAVVVVVIVLIIIVFVLRKK